MFNNNRNQLLSPLQYESSSLTTTTTTTTNGSNMSNSTCNKLNYTGNMSHHQQLLQMDMNSHNNSAFFPSVFGATHSNTVNNYKDIYTMYPFYYYPRHFNQNDFGRRNRNLTYTPSSATTLYTSSPIHVPKFTLMNFEGNNTNNSNNNNYQLQQNESLFMKESNTVTKHSREYYPEKEELEELEEACVCVLSQNFQKNLRIQVILEAETAVTKKDEESITYLNRGQVYSIQLKDNLSKNQVITSTISISFHLSKHRAITDTFWKYWLSQQSEPNPRLIEIDNTNSIGVTNVNLSNFDKIIFNWNGEVGAKIMIRFKFLSTDFTKTKGVKGIPLRVLMKSQFQEINTEMINNHETSFCTIKLFRDKGAERKTKDDSKHRTKLLEKIYGKTNGLYDITNSWLFKDVLFFFYV
ncbi:CP2 transcription factor-domain-containing protein [Cokeromyces recurvatus]|uniref:CP2 transcription factor-domain-containing protein n=1 Tax=Cokeromyces recurvatus TaxID=90255 RepID=UPI00221FB6A3|nr:CP2 transcription factor-domain-containing protein [Cokeromyces recurvatus]KAI7903739.1 CP2 transcription factor-domain-containing protein [Cokeromyces recurvatus]